MMTLAVSPSTPGSVYTMIPPVPQVGPAIRSGAAFKSAPETALLKLVAVAWRSATGSGNSALSTVPGGLVAVMWRYMPAFNGIVSSWVRMNVVIRRVSQLWRMPAVGTL